jgi:hypothetical protein
LLREIEDDNFDSIRQGIFPNRPKHHPYATYGSGVRIAQGLYLGKLTNHRRLPPFSIEELKAAVWDGTKPILLDLRKMIEVAIASGMFHNLRLANGTLSVEEVYIHFGRQDQVLRTVR